MFNLFGHGIAWLSESDDSFEWSPRFKCIPLFFGKLYITHTQWPAR